MEIAWVATFFIWMVLLLVGPLRGLIVGMQGNALIVGYRHLPIAERLRQWEVWMALPLIAYLLSILSGLGVSLLMEPQPGWGMVCLGSGVMVLYYFGLFWGMQDHRKEVTLQDVTDPGFFLAEIKGRALAGRLEAILEGPADSVDGRCNLLGALRKAMAVCGYENLKDLQKAELVATAPREIR